MAYVAGKSFLDYLNSQSLLKNCHVEELEKLYLQWKKTQTTARAKEFKFDDIVHALEFSDNPLLRVEESGNVVFNGTKQWKNKTNPAIAERKKLFNILRSTKNRHKLYVGNGSIDISCHSPNCESSEGHFKFKMQDSPSNFEILIHNQSKKHSVVLKKCLPLRDSTAFSFSDKFECTRAQSNAMCELFPGNVYKIMVTCTLEEAIGRYDSDLFFNFEIRNSKQESFRMLRCLSCMKSNQLIDDLQPKEPFVEKPKITKYYASNYMHGDKVTISGNKLENVVKLGTYEVPRKLKVALKKGIFKENAEDVATTQQEKIWRNLLLKSNLTPENYTDRFSLLLHLEEMQGQADIRLYDLRNTTIEPSRSGTGSRYWLKVPGLAEKRPSVIRGDRIDLYKLTPDGLVQQDTAYVGYVHEVQAEKVLLAMNSGFTHIVGMKFNAVFSFPRFPIKLEHRAVGPLLTQRHAQMLFPSPTAEPAVPEVPLRYFNANIEKNHEQQQAVKSIVFGTSTLPYIVYGPPGTGKTVTMVEAIQQVVKRQKEVHVLVCAPSNSACDLLVERLLVHIDKGKVFRMCAASRDAFVIPKTLEKVTNYNQANREFYFPTKQELQDYSVLVTTLITAGRLASAQFPENHFDYVFVDEAGYAMEPELMTAVAGVLSTTGRIVMAGDPKQLGPVLFSHLASIHDLGVSFLERLMSSRVYEPNTEQKYDKTVVTKLVKNYRSHEDILELPDRHFYDNELTACADEFQRNLMCDWSVLPKRGFPIIFHGVKGKDQRSSSSPSYFNLEEAMTVQSYVERLLDARGNGITGHHIGIISPYRKQAHTIRTVLNKKMKAASGAAKIKIGSVEEFQGQERRVIIISTVRSSNEHLKEDNRFRLGFLRNPKRFNVAITRSMCLLIVVGDPDILSVDYYWRSFIEFCQKKKGYTGIAPDTKSFDSDDSSDGAAGGDTSVNDLLARMKLLDLDKIEEDQQGRRAEE